MKKLTLLIVCLLWQCYSVFAQPGTGTRWSTNGQAYYKADKSGIVAIPLDGSASQVKVPASAYHDLPIKDFTFSADEKRVLLFTNSKKVWRYETRGDYWILDIPSGKLQQLGRILNSKSRLQLIQLQQLTR